MSFKGPIIVPVILTGLSTIYEDSLPTEFALYYDHTHFTRKIISCLRSHMAKTKHYLPKITSVYEQFLKNCLQLEVYFSTGSAVQYPLKNITPADPLKLTPSNSNNNNNNNNNECGT